MKWYIDIVKQYSDFNGRSSRGEYWKFFLLTLAISLGLSIVEVLAGGPGALAMAFNIIVLIPAIAIGVRRMHDTNRSGWWLLVPIAGIVFLCQEGQKSANRYGELVSVAEISEPDGYARTQRPESSHQTTTRPVELTEPIFHAKSLAGNLAKKAIGTLPDGYYLTHLGIGSLFPMAILAAGQTALTATFVILATLNTLAYPFSRHFYDRHSHLIPVDQTIFVKIIAAICCWGLAVIIGPVGLLFSWNRRKDVTDRSAE